jgi:hypothetical protein
MAKKVQEVQASSEGQTASLVEKFVLKEDEKSLQEILLEQTPL